MNTSKAPSGAPENLKSRKLGMARDLQFLFFLLNASIYQKQRPNLYERLREYSNQAGALEVELHQVDSDRKDALDTYESKLNIWKAGLYEFLESML